MNRESGERDLLPDETCDRVTLTSSAVASLTNDAAAGHTVSSELDGRRVWQLPASARLARRFLKQTLALWCQLLPYGYSCYKASRARSS